MSRFSIAAALVLVALCGTASASGEGWFTDFDEAQKVAAKTGKDIFVDNSGSDWCGWCVRLDKEIFQHAAFLDAAKKLYVLVNLDFPKGEEARAKVPNPRRNEELKNLWGIRGFPTVLLMRADGEIWARTGYKAGGPEKYIEHLAELRAKFRDGLQPALDLAKTIEAAEGDARAAGGVKALDLIETISAAPYASKLVPGVRLAIESDPENAKGLKLRGLKVLLSSGNANDQDMAAAEALDPKNENGLLEIVVHAGMSKVRSKEAVAPALARIETLLELGEIKDHDRAIQLRANAAYWSWKVTMDQEGARRHATALKALEPKNPRLQGLYKQILGE